MDRVEISKRYDKVIQQDAEHDFEGAHHYEDALAWDVLKAVAEREPAAAHLVALRDAHFQGNDDIRRWYA